MKLICTILLAIAACFALAQDMQAPIPKELDMVKFMSGNWKGDLTAAFMGQDEKGTGSISAKLGVGGRMLESDHVYDFKSTGKMIGKHMLGYDPVKKSFFAFWFDSMSDGAMEMWGNWTGDTMTMTAKPTAHPGGEGEMVMRAVYKKVDDRKFVFNLDMKQGDNWVSIIKGTYTKI